MIKSRAPSSAPRDGISFALKNSNGVLENCLFDPDELGFIVNSLIDEKITLVPSHTGWVPWPVLFKLPETADVLDDQDLNLTFDRTISAIELAALEETCQASPTPTEIAHYWYAINTILKAT